jgi:hypothetical protein
MAVIQQIEHAPWASDEDLDAASDILNLSISAHASIDGGASSFAISIQIGYRLMHLFGKLSCGLQDQDPQGTGWILVQLLQYRQNKCRCFSCPGLGQP